MLLIKFTKDIFYLAFLLNLESLMVPPFWMFPIPIELGDLALDALSLSKMCPSRSHYIQEQIENSV